jgi:hypothetical protein
MAEVLRGTMTGLWYSLEYRETPSDPKDDEAGWEQKTSVR